MERARTARGVLEDALAERLEHEDEQSVSVELLPPLSATEVSELERRLGSPLPEEIRDLVGYAGGLESGPSVVSTSAGGSPSNFQPRSPTVSPSAATD